MQTQTQTQPTARPKTNGANHPAATELTQLRGYVPLQVTMIDYGAATVIVSLLMALILWPIL